jgi:hypothetical protein
MSSSPSKTNFSSRKPATGPEAFSGADLSQGAVCPRSSQTLDREHGWNYAGFQSAGGVEKKWKGKRLRKNTEFRRVQSGASGVSKEILLLRIDAYYSCLSAMTGSVIAARRAGKYPATMPTISNAAKVAIKVTGSLGLTPNRK